MYKRLDLQPSSSNIKTIDVIEDEKIFSLKEIKNILKGDDNLESNKITC